jgi:preprotein translocase subunit SecA
MILQKIDGDTKPLEQLLRSIHYQEISFQQGNKIVSKSNYSDWSKRIGEMRASSRKNERKSDRSAKGILEQIIQTQNNKTNGTPRKTLETIAEQAEVFRNKARNRKVVVGNEISEIHREIQELYNQKSYQENPEEYIRLHLDEIVPLILYAWSIANKPQFPKDTQIFALLLFIHSREKGLLEQVRTGEGKTLIVGITAAFMALCGNAVDIVSSNRDLAIEGEKKCRSFFQLLKIDSGHICSDDDQVNHQSYQSNRSTIQGNTVYGEVGAFQRDILEDEFNNQQIFGQRYKNSKEMFDH